MTKKIKLLIVDDEVRFLNTLTQRLGLRDFDVTAVSDGQAAIEEADKREFDLALVDLKMPGMSGERVLETLKKKWPLLEVIIFTGHGSIDSAVECTKLGSSCYLQKPCETEELLRVLQDAYTKRLQNKLQIDEKKMQEILNVAVGDSAMGILRKLRALDDEKEKS